MYNDQEGTLNCTECSIGRFSNKVGQTSLTSCQPCVAGMYNDGLTTCKQCSAGKWSSITKITSDAECNGNCSAGKYSDVPGLSSDAECKLCSAGKWSTMIGITSDAACNNECVHGTYSTESGRFSDPCQNCPGGYYGPTTGATKCIPFPDGTYSNEVGAFSPSSSIRCPIGTYGVHDGATSCEKCPLGTYGTEEGSINKNTCHGCASGAYQNEEGKSECKSCAIGQASASNEKPCTPCVSGMYQDKKLATGYACTSCAFGRVSNKDKSGCDVDGGVVVGFVLPPLLLCLAGLSYFMYQKKIKKTKDIEMIHPLLDSDRLDRLEAAPEPDVHTSPDVYSSPVPRLGSSDSRHSSSSILSPSSSYYDSETKTTNVVAGPKPNAKRTVQFAGNTDFGSKSKVTRKKRDPTITMKGNKRKRFQNRQPRKMATKTVEMKKTGTKTMAKRISGLFQRMTGGASSPTQEPKNPSTARTTKKSNSRAKPKRNTTTSKKASKKKARKNTTGATKTKTPPEKGIGTHYNLTGTNHQTYIRSDPKYFGDELNDKIWYYGYQKLFNGRTSKCWVNLVSDELLEVKPTFAGYMDAIIKPAPPDYFDARIMDQAITESPVHAWICKHLGLSLCILYGNVLVEAGYTKIEDVFNVSSDELKQIGLSSGKRRKFLRALSEAPMMKEIKEAIGRNPTAAQIARNKEMEKERKAAKKRREERKAATNKEEVVVEEEEVEYKANGAKIIKERTKPRKYTLEEID